MWGKILAALFFPDELETLQQFFSLQNHTASSVCRWYISINKKIHISKHFSIIIRRYRNQFSVSNGGSWCAKWTSNSKFALDRAAGCPEEEITRVRKCKKTKTIFSQNSKCSLGRRNFFRRLRKLDFHFWWVILEPLLIFQKKVDFLCRGFWPFRG